jgi:hypothetical protein
MTTRMKKGATFTCIQTIDIEKLKDLLSCVPQTDPSRKTLMKVYQSVVERSLKAKDPTKLQGLICDELDIFKYARSIHAT